MIKWSIDVDGKQVPIEHWMKGNPKREAHFKQFLRGQLSKRDVGEKSKTAAMVQLFGLEFKTVAQRPDFYQEAIELAEEKIKAGADPGSWQTYEEVGREMEEAIKPVLFREQREQEYSDTIAEMRAGRVGVRNEIPMPPDEED